MEGKLLFNIQSHNLSNSMWASLLRFHYSDYEFDNVIKERLLSQRASLLKNISVPDSTFPVQLTNDQRTDDWYSQRRVRITASTCKAVYTAKSAITVKNILSALLWTSREDSVTTLSMKYGNENEDTAISNYLQQKQKLSSEFKVQKCGLWVNSKHPELACSPDSLVMDPTMNGDTYGILEVKCPIILRDECIQNFDSVLSPTQKHNFCLKKENGVISLKRNHAYYFQIQMQLGVMSMNWCDFHAWSPKGSFTERIAIDRSFWESLKNKLVNFHHSWLCPEYFEHRIPRKLKPFFLE